MDKVIGGTPKGGKNLCLTCEHSLVIKGENLEKRIFCGAMYDAVFTPSFSVVECNRYLEKNAPSESDFEKIAWIVETRTRGPKGFVRGGHLEVEINPPKKKSED